MGFRLLHVSDIHLDSPFSQMGCRADAARRRRHDLRQALVRAGELAQQQNCSAITIGGDLFESERVGPDTADFLRDTFSSWQPLRVFIAPGNHDPYLPGSPYRTVEWSPNVHIFCEPVLQSVELGDGLRLWGLGHPAPVWLEDPLGTAAELPSGEIHLALFHGAEIGSRPQGKAMHGPFSATTIKERGFALALCGHYHSRRLDCGSGLLYPGTIEPLALDETGGRGPVVIEVTPSGEVTMQAHDTNRWWALPISCDISDARHLTAVCDVAAEAVRLGLEALPADRSLVSLTLTGSPHAALDVVTIEQRIRDSLPVAGIKIHDASEPEIDLERVRLESSVRGTFVNALLEELEAAADGDKAVIEDALNYGLQALAGREVGLR